MQYTGVQYRQVLTNAIGLGEHSIGQKGVQVMRAAEKAAQSPQVKSDGGTRWTALAVHQAEKVLYPSLSLVLN